MGVLPQTMGHGTDQWLISRNGWTTLPLGGWDAYGQLLQLPYWFVVTFCRKAYNVIPRSCKLL